jgi:hypothetical protein
MEMATISLASLKSSVAPVGPFIAFLHNPLTSAMSAQFPYQAMQFSSSASSPLVGSESSPRLIQEFNSGPISTVKEYFFFCWQFLFHVF